MAGLVKYLRRALDDLLDKVFPDVPAIAIEGAKAVGKTETARRRVQRVLELDDPHPGSAARPHGCPARRRRSGPHRRMTALSAGVGSCPSRGGPSPRPGRPAPRQRPPTAGHHQPFRRGTHRIPRHATDVAHRTRCRPGRNRCRQAPGTLSDDRGTQPAQTARLRRGNMRLRAARPARHPSRRPGPPTRQSWGRQPPARPTNPAAPQPRPTATSSPGSGCSTPSRAGPRSWPHWPGSKPDQSISCSTRRWRPVSSTSPPRNCSAAPRARGRSWGSSSSPWSPCA